MKSRFQMTVRGRDKRWAIDLSPDIPRSEIARMRCDGLVIEQVVHCEDAGPSVVGSIRGALDKVKAK